MSDTSVSPTPLESAQVKSRIMAEHARIRTKLDRVDKLARAVSADATLDPNDLLAGVRDLADSLSVHLALEEDILVPLLRASPNFGAATADEVLREHAEQRMMLESIFADLASVKSNAIVSVGALELVAAVRDDIRHEEQTFLAAHVELGAVAG